MWAVTRNIQFYCSGLMVVQGDTTFLILIPSIFYGGIDRYQYLNPLLKSIASLDINKSLIRFNTDQVSNEARPLGGWGLVGGHMYRSYAHASSEPRNVPLSLPTSCLNSESLSRRFDIESAYRLIPVHPNDRPLLGMIWKGKLYVDTTLPFGLRSAP